MGRTGEGVRRLTRHGYKPAWSSDGTHLVYSLENVELNPQNSQAKAELWIVTVATGEARRLPVGDGTMPNWSPHDQRIVYAARMRDRSQGDLWTVKTDGSDGVPIARGAGRDWNPVWSPDGQFIYFVSDRSGSMNLWRIPIDEASGKTLGPAQPITTPATSLAHPTISGDGTRIAYSSALVTSNVQALSFDPIAGAVTGESSWLTTGSRRWANPDPSPDGRWVAFYSLVDPEGHIYVAPADGTGGLRQVTGDAAIDRIPKWSPDGKWIGFFSTRSGRFDIWKIRPDGSDLQQVTEGGGSYFAWSPDGTRMSVFRNVEETGGIGEVAIFAPDRPAKDQKPEDLPSFGTQARFFANHWSPDGTRLVGQVGAGKSGVAMYSFATRSYEPLSDSGEWPVWLPDNRRVLFVRGGKTFCTVDTRTKQVKTVFSVGRDVIGPPRLTRNGRRMYFTRRVTESDIWMLTLK
jgi:Tol biopolymer transport system component